MEQETHNNGNFFEELKLHAGDRLQIEIPSTRRDVRYFTTLVGYVKDLSVLIRNPVVNGLSLPMRDGETLIVRGFSGVEAFSFESRVARVCLAPFPYLHLSFPHTITTTPVRHEVRVKVNIPVKITQGGSGKISHAVISNVSATGIQIESEEEFGGKDDEVAVSFHFNIQPHDYEAHIESDAVIQKVTLQDSPAGGIAFQYGVKLLGLHSSQAILLQNLIYQQLLENHHNLA